jgi:ABC-type nickel/cobalt efflux system permease component RcnA
MTAIIFRFLLVGGLFALIAWGIYKIWRDWRGEFRAMDRIKHERDLRERDRPDVVTLKRDKDGKFRPPEDTDAHS